MRFLQVLFIWFLVGLILAFAPHYLQLAFRSALVVTAFTVIGG